MYTIYVDIWYQNQIFSNTIADCIYITVDQQIHYTERGCGLLWPYAGNY